MNGFMATLALGALLAATPLIMSEARAELEVKRSSAPGLKAGETVGDGISLNVPAGKEVEFFKLPAGPTYTVKGPYRGTLAKYRNPCSLWKGVAGKCRKDTLETGATKAK